MNALAFLETDQGSNLKLSRLDVNAGIWQVQTLDDAGSSVLATILTLTRAGALAISSGLTAGSGAVGIIDTTGKVPAFSSTYFASLSLANGTSIPAAQLTGVCCGAATNVDLLNAVNTHTAFGLHTWSAGSNGTQRLVTANTTSDTEAIAGYRLNAGTTIMVLDAFSQGYTTSGQSIASSVKLEATGVGGLTLSASSASGDVRIYSRNALAATFGASQALALTGNVAVNTNKFTVNATTGDTVMAGTSTHSGIASFATDLLPISLFTSNIGALTNKFKELHVAELWSETLVAQSTMATIGGRVLVAPTNILTADLAAAGLTLTVKYNNFANGDRIYLESNGKLEWMAIASLAGGSAGAYTYSVTRNLDGSGANDWFTGDAALDTGTTGNGFIDLYSVGGVLSGIGPTIVGNVRTGTTYSNIAPRWAIGRLDPLYSYTSTSCTGSVPCHGVAFGDSANAWMSMDTTNGLRGMSGANVRFQIAADGSGRLANSNITWNTSGDLTVAGSATIGGWSIGSTYIRDASGTRLLQRALDRQPRFGQR